MSVNKLIRELRRALAKIGVNIVSHEFDRGIVYVVVKIDGADYRLTVACTPKIPEVTIKAVLRDVKRIQRGTYATH